MGATYAFNSPGAWLSASERWVGGFGVPLAQSHFLAPVFLNPFAGVSQLVESLLPKQDVVGSIPITRSKPSGFT